MWSSLGEKHNFMKLRIALILIQISFVVYKWKCVFERERGRKVTLRLLMIFLHTLFMIWNVSSVLWECLYRCVLMFIVCVNVHGAYMYLCPKVVQYGGRGEGVCMYVVCQRHISPTVICCRLIICHADRTRNRITTNLNCPARAFRQIF